MADAWGVARPQPSETVTRAPAAPKVKVTPKVAHAAHKGIVWIHLSAMIVWLLMAALLGTLASFGKPVPLVVIIVGVAAAGGHALFLLTHLYFAAAAQKRLAARS